MSDSTSVGTSFGASHAATRITKYTDLSGLDGLFEPRGIALFGASSDPTKIGGRPLRFMLEHGYEGGIYPINPKSDTVQGVRAYSSLEEAEGIVDLALIALPKQYVLDAIHQSGRKGAKVVTVFSAGYAEVGPEGVAEQQELLGAAAMYGMRLLGPNCIGSMNSKTRAVGSFAAAVGTKYEEEPLASVAFVSQSGAIAIEQVVAGAQRGIKFDPWLSTGNEADVQLADTLAYLALDESVKVIAVYLEGCRDGLRLREALEIAQEAGKPVVAIKVGRSEVGATAVASHTASLVGADEVFDTLFAQYGVIRVDSMAELFDVCYAISIGFLPAGNKFGVITGSGGTGIISADAATDYGLVLPTLSEGLQAELKEIWAPAGVGNPIDVTAQVMNDRTLLPAFMDVCLKADAFDSTLLALTYMALFEPWTDQVVEALTEARSNYPEAPLFVTAIANPQVRRALEELHIPVFADPTIAIRTISRLVEYSASRERFVAEQAKEAATRPARELPAVPTEINEVTAKAFISQAGISVVPERVVLSAAEAAEAQIAFGEAVAMKVVSADLPHKSEVGGVMLGVADGQAAAEAYERILASVAEKSPESAIDGVLVSPMITDGIETIVGVVEDPAFGPVVMFGLGGIFVEILGDVSYRLAPIDRDTAYEMIHEVRGSALLRGARGRPVMDIEALAQNLVNISELADGHRGNLGGIEINPLIVRPAGHGVIAVDALITPFAGTGTTDD